MRHSDQMSEGAQAKKVSKGRYRAARAAKNRESKKSAQPCAISVRYWNAYLTKIPKKQVPQFRLKVCCQEITKIQKYWNREKCTRVLMCHQRNVLHCWEPILPKYQTNFIGHSLLQKIVENTPFCWWFLLPIFISYSLQKMADVIFVTSISSSASVK